MSQGFLAWWERASGLSVLLAWLLSPSGPCPDQIDRARIHAIGFSLGAHPVLSCLGARTDMARCLDRASGSRIAHAPAEFSDLADHLATFRAS